MEAAKMVDKTNMSLDDIIKMDRKNFKGRPTFIKNKNSVAKNVVRKARNSFLNRKTVKSPNKNFKISEKRQDLRNRLKKTNQMNKVIPQNIQRTTRNSNFRRPNTIMNISNKPRINNRNNSNVMNSVPAFRITTKNERYESNNQRGRQYERPTNKRFHADNNNNFNSFPNRNQNNQFSGIWRPIYPNGNNYQNANRNGRGDIRRNPDLSRDREYELMARALIEAHRESRYTFNQPTSSHRRYNQIVETRGYPYRR